MSKLTDAFEGRPEFRRLETDTSGWFCLPTERRFIMHSLIAD